MSCCGEGGEGAVAGRCLDSPHFCVGKLLLLPLDSFDAFFRRVRVRPDAFYVLPNCGCSCDFGRNTMVQYEQQTALIVPAARPHAIDGEHQPGTHPRASTRPTSSSHHLLLPPPHPAPSLLTTPSILPSPNVEVLFSIERSHDRTIREFAPCQRRESLLRRLGFLVLNVDLPNPVAGPTAAVGTRHLDVEEGAVFGAFLFDVEEDFCSHKIQ